MTLKIINSLLIIFTVFMGTRPGWNMVTAKPEMLEMFGNRLDIGQIR